MSAINDLLELIRLQVEIYHNARVCGDWQIQEHLLGQTCFHSATQGDCLLRVPDHGEWHMKTGDVVIFPEELPHTMEPCEDLRGEQQHLDIASSQEIQGTTMLCGSVNFKHSGGKYLLTTLPPVLIIDIQKAKKWLQPLTQLIVNESLRSVNLNNPVINRLSELLLFYALRCFAENDNHKANIFSLYSNDKLAPAIAAIHQYPEKKWQLASLASECAMSRTQFSQLFTQVAGQTATDYLCWWRMQVAWPLLYNGESVGKVAEAVGYQSEAAFARTFKKTFGETVGHVRRKESQT